MKILNMFDKTILGYVCSFGGAIFVAGGIISGQMLGRKVPVFQSNCIKYTVQFPFTLSVLLVTRRSDLKLPKFCTFITVLTISIISLFMSNIFAVLSTWHLPVAVVDALAENTLMILAAFTAIYMKRCNVVLPIAVMISCAGSLLLFQPELIFGKGFLQNNPGSIINNQSVLSNISKSENSSNILDDQEVMINCSAFNFNKSIGCDLLDAALNNTSLSLNGNPLLGFIFSVGFGMTLWIHEQVNVPYMIKAVHINVIFFWTTIGGFIISVPAMFIEGTPVAVTGVYDLGMLSLLTVSRILASYLVMHAVTYISPSHVAIILPIATVMLFALQKTILKEIEVGPDNWLEYMGLGLVVISCLLPPVYDIVKEKQMQNMNLDEKLNYSNETIVTKL